MLEQWGSGEGEKVHEHGESVNGCIYGVQAGKCGLCNVLYIWCKGSCIQEGSMPVRCRCAYWAMERCVCLYGGRCMHALTVYAWGSA